MNIDALLQSNVEIQLHVLAALLATVLGVLQLVSRKGTTGHRLMGSAWMAAMVLVAVSSLFIHEIRILGPWSPIHLLSLLTLFGLWAAVVALRKGHYRRHGMIMASLFVFALLGAGAFALLPGRLMHTVIFG